MLEEKIEIKNIIYEIRGQQVMLDSDLAKLYQVETKRINEAVKNNPEKFPDRFSWILLEDEWVFLRSKISTLENNYTGRGHYRKYYPRVFTEQGVAMLATILKSKVAIQVSINIMDAFVEMRKYISNNLIEQKYINDLVIKDSKRIDVLKETFNGFKERTNHIFFEGQIYDAYSLLIDILKKANKEIIIIDNYAGKELLDILKDNKTNIIIISKNIDEILKEKYNKQYSNVTFIINNSFHDRFIILDKKKLYTCGSSFKDLGKKCFYIGEIKEKEYLKIILKTLNL